MEVRSVAYFGWLCWEPSALLTRALMDRDLCTGAAPRHSSLEDSCSCSQIWSLLDCDRAKARALGNSVCSPTPA